MAKIALTAQAAMLEPATAQDAAPAEPAAVSEPHSIFDDLTLIGALLFGIDDADLRAIDWASECQVSLAKD